jgi:glycosyltransferase involved in cell wall biosynthesis
LGQLEKLFFGFILRRITKFIVLGESLKPIFGQWATPDQVTVVPNGVRKASASIPIVETYRRDRSLFRVLALSTLSRQKGLFVLLEAIPFVIREHANVEFCIAGPWWGATTEDEAMALISESCIDRHVRFMGQVTGEQKTELLRSGDVFVFPGVQQEGQPLTVLEAMSEGLPVIATDRGCLKETVIEGATGFIVPPCSPSAIAEKLLQLIREPELLRYMRHNARMRFESEYTLNRFTARIEKVFNEVLLDATNQSMGCVRRSETL